MQTARSEFGTASLNGKIYAIGGLTSTGYTNAVEEYDPVTNTWTSKAPINTARAGLCVVTVNGKIYAIGGQTSSGYTAIIEEYNPISNIWVNKTSMAIARGWSAGTVLNGKIYIVGGRTSTGYLNKVSEYDLTTNTWAEKAVMTTSRERLAAAVANGKIYAIGGNNATYLNTVEEYNPATNSWSTKAGLPTGRSGLGAVVINKRIYTIAGLNSTGYKNVVEEYYPEMNTWITKPSLMATRSNIGVGEVNGTVYAIGGEQGSANFLKTVEEYYVPSIQFQYDSGGRLKYVLRNGNILATYDYDDNGNLIKGTSNEIPLVILVNDGGEDWINLSWNTVNDATAYELYKDGVLLTTTTSSSYTVTSLQVNTSYKFYIRAKKGIGVLGVSKIETVRTAPAAPTVLSVSNITSTKAVINWNIRPEATAYRVSLNSLSNVIGETQTNSQSIIDLAPYTSYTAFVQSCNGLYGNPNSISFKTDTLPAPSGLTFSNVKDDSLSFYWSSVEGATGYKLYVNDQYNASTTSTNYMISSLLPNTSYTIGVSAYYGAHEGSRSSYQTKTAPTPVTGLQVVEVKDTSITISWSPSNGAFGYYIAKDNEASIVTYTNGTSYKISCLSPGTTYQFYVMSYNGSCSRPTTINATTEQISYPTNLNASSVNESSVLLSWTGSSAATSYKLYLNGQYLATTTNSYYVFSGLTANTNYTLGVTAVRSIYESALSTKEIKTAPPRPTGLSLNNSGDLLGTFSWLPSTGAIYYIVYVQEYQDVWTEYGRTAGCSIDVPILFNYTYGVSASNGTAESTIAKKILLK